MFNICFQLLRLYYTLFTAVFVCVWQIVRHGGALGLGLAALGTARQDVYDLLKSNLYQDDAVTGKYKRRDRIQYLEG